MNFNTFRRGGLFDPITFDSGRALAKGTGEWFGGFGEPVMSASNPADLRMMADKALSSGDAEKALLYSRMAEQAENKPVEKGRAEAAEMAAKKMQAVMLDIVSKSAANDEKKEELFASINGGTISTPAELRVALDADRKKEAQAKQDKVLRVALEKKFGKEYSDILMTVPADKRGDIIRDAMKSPDEKGTIRPLVGEDGNKYDWWVVNGQKRHMIGLHEAAGATKGQKAPSGYRWTDDGNLEPIKGGPADKKTAAEAGKMALLEGARKMADELDSYVYEVNPDGSINYDKINRTNILNMNIPFGGTPFSDGRSANAIFKDNVEARIRAESGAAVPESEVVRANERLRPSILDSDETIRVKTRLRRQFFDIAHDLYSVAGSGDEKRMVPTEKARKFWKDAESELQTAAAKSIPVPAGVDPADWATYTPEQQMKIAEQIRIQSP